MDTPKQDGMYLAAASVTTVENPIGTRFIWIPMPKPWWWVFSFWRRRWLNYGRFERLLPNDPRYANAHYEMAPVWLEYKGEDNNMEVGGI